MRAQEILDFSIPGPVFAAHVQVQAGDSLGEGPGASESLAVARGLGCRGFARRRGESGGRDTTCGPSPLRRCLLLAPDFPEFLLGHTGRRGSAGAYRIRPRSGRGTLPFGSPLAIAPPLG